MISYPIMTFLRAGIANDDVRLLDCFTPLATRSTAPAGERGLGGSLLGRGWRQVIESGCSGVRGCDRFWFVQ